MLLYYYYIYNRPKNRKETDMNKRKLMCLLLAACMIVALAACGAKKAEPEQPGSVTEEGEGKVLRRLDGDGYLYYMDYEADYYGHGYHRFLAIASQLGLHRDRGSEEYRTVMPEESALVILRGAAQNPYTEGAGISMTQYSAIYNNAKRTLTIWPFQNYSVGYRFDVTGAQLSAAE